MKSCTEGSFASNVIPRISIVVACYNCAAFLAKTIESVLAQDLDEWELILVDDGSADDTAEIIRCYCSRDSRIKGVWQHNGGQAKARNFGAAHLSPQSEGRAGEGGVGIK